MITLADLTPRRDPFAYARWQLDTHEVLLRRFWSRRAAFAFWAAWFTALGGFLALAVWSDHRYFLPGDLSMTLRVQELDRFNWAEPLFGAVNRFGGYDFIAAVLISSFLVLLVRGLRFEALIMAGAGALHYVQLGVRQVVERPFPADSPPWYVYSDWHLRQWPGPNGFPSGHVFGEVVVYGLIFAYAGRVLRFWPLAWLVRLVCLALIALGGPARMYTGAHWPSDVYGSMLLGGLYLALAWRIDQGILHIRTVSAERVLATDAGLRDEPRTRRPRIRLPLPSRKPAAAPQAAEAAAPPEPARTR
jgi:membrane-associated phospholipid phosphatase